MKKLTRIKRSMSGFTLVELMVVVAIIGILSAIAIPNFKKYQAKSKTSEAKIRLASLYMAETSALTDYDTYATCLAAIGFEYDPNGSHFYAVGFSETNDDQNARIESAGVTACTADATFAYPATRGAQAAAASTIESAIVDATTMSYTAEAVGYIASSTDANKWTINDGKALKQTAPGGL